MFTGNILKQPMCENITKKVLDLGYPNADAIMERGVLLPVHHGLNQTMFEKLHSTINLFISERL